MNPNEFGIKKSSHLKERCQLLWEELKPRRELEPSHGWIRKQRSAAQQRRLNTQPALQPHASEELVRKEEKNMYILSCLQAELPATVWEIKITVFDLSAQDLQKSTCKHLASLHNLALKPTNSKLEHQMEALIHLESRTVSTCQL